jgi:hypothetical protein
MPRWTPTSCHRILYIVNQTRMSTTTTYDQIFHDFSFLLPHISIVVSTKAKIIFRGTFFVAISTNQLFMETMTK